jgi:uncharacterized protein
MSNEKNKSLILAFYDAGNRGEIDQCLAMIDDEIVWNNMGSTRFSGQFIGKVDVIERLIGPLFGQLKAGIHSTIDNIVAEGEFVVAQVRGQAETADGQVYNNRYCHVFRIRDGRIREVTEYLDTALVNSVFGG